MYQIGTERPIEIGAKGYDGTYEIEKLVIQYHVPRRLIGPPYFTFASNQFHDASDLRIFVSSFGEAAGISLGLSPYPSRLATTRYLSDYVDFYGHHAEDRGLTAKVTAEEISGITWMRIEERYKNGRLARVIFVYPMLTNFQVVFRFGLSDDLDPNTVTRWTEWTPAMSETMRSFRIIRK